MAGEERAAGGSSKRQGAREAGQTEGSNQYVDIKQGTGGRTFELMPPRLLERRT